MDEKMGTGDLQMADILNLDESKTMNLFRNRFKRYKKLTEELGEHAAFETMMEKYPEQQKVLMGALIDDNTIAAGFKKSIPLLRLMGFVTEIVDISQDGADAALEIQRVCPAMSMAQEYGLETPCRVLCEMEQEAARRAFPGMKAEILSKQAEGDRVCLFTYERPAQAAIQSPKKASNSFSKMIDFGKALPILFQVGMKKLKMRFSS